MWGNIGNFSDLAKAAQDLQEQASQATSSITVGLWLIGGEALTVCLVVSAHVLWWTNLLFVLCVECGAFKALIFSRCKSFHGNRKCETKNCAGVVCMFTSIHLNEHNPVVTLDHFC